MTAHIHTSRTQQITDHSIFGFCVLFAIFVGSYAVAPLLATKIIAVGPFHVAAGILAYSVTFPVTDITAEVYGEKYARHIVTSGLIGMITIFALTQIAVHWPAAPFWENHEAFHSVFGTSWRVFFGSLLAYYVSQNLDVYIFARIREKMDGRWIWFRNNLSTSVSKFVDMSLFITIAFYGVYENGELITIIINGYIIHLVIAVADTPLVYLGIWLLRKIYPELKI